MLDYALCEYSLITQGLMLGDIKPFFIGSYSGSRGATHFLWQVLLRLTPGQVRRTCIKVSGCPAVLLLLIPKTKYHCGMLRRDSV
jgi:hypothetical protein